DRQGLAQIAYIEVTLSKTSFQEGNGHPFEIKIKPSAKDPRAASFIAQLNRIYQVESRWNGSLDTIGEHVFRRIQQFLLTDVLMGNDLSDVRFLEERLKILMALTDVWNVGRDSFGMVTVWMLKFFVDTIRREGKDALVYRNLGDWAAEQCEAPMALLQRVEEIYRRVPNDCS
ncbi:MAG: hypothetical protein N2556_09510, partial [Anaerolineae bacterium]|nr:hypothetical protein [Anaerolineae bacterium]